MTSVCGLPLDKKEIIDGSSNRPLPALHPHWTDRSRFVAYVAPPRDSSDQGLMGEWFERLQYISTDLHWLLQLPHQKFWCQVIFDESLHHMLDSFLRYSPRPYDMDSELTGHYLNLHDEVTRLIFFTYLRMATYKESKENWLTPEVFGEIIYENFLFDVPKLLDLCALYGHANTALLSKMVSNVFTQQPQYMDDLRAAAPTIIQVFVNIAIKCGLAVEPTGPTPQKLELGHNEPVDIASMETEDLQDVVSYLADTAVTLTSFLTVYPPACKVLQELQFCSHLAHMYEKLIPGFQSTMKQRQFDSVRQKKMMRNKLCEARVHLLTTFHLIVSYNCLQPVLSTISSKEGDNTSKSAEINKHMEDFLAIMSAVLGEKRFLADYEGQFSFQDDMDILSQAAEDVDEAHYRYILEAINAAFAAHGKRKKPKGNTNTGGRTSPDGSPCPPCAQSSALQTTASPTHKSHSTHRGAEAAPVTGVELDSLVCAVKDLLPHLGNGFIQLALEELAYSVESVVGAVLEDKLPETLRHIPFSLDSVDAPAVMEDPAPQSLIVESRRNIYDNDEFDVFNNPAVDVQHIHKGKRTVEKSVLEDKESIKDFKALYDAYGSMDVVSMYDPQMYDDEYDDTYDINNVGADDADSADELTQRRPFTVPRVLQKQPARTQQSDDSSDEEETPRDHFVQDPAKVRERQEQKRAAHNQGPPPARDLKGKSKGQGQAEDVLRNRKFKEKNKGVRSNHNRRAMADKKQSKGMF